MPLKSDMTAASAEYFTRRLGKGITSKRSRTSIAVRTSIGILPKSFSCFCRNSSTAAQTSTLPLIEYSPCWGCEPHANPRQTAGDDRLPTHGLGRRERRQEVPQSRFHRWPYLPEFPAVPARPDRGTLVSGRRPGRKTWPSLPTTWNLWEAA